MQSHNVSINSKIFFLLIAMMLVSSGCFTYRSYVPLDLEEIEMQVPITINKIVIEDMRTEISVEEDIKIPFMSGLKRKSWKHHPKLTIEHKQLIEKTIAKNFNASKTDNGEIQVNIRYACKEFEQTGKSEIERVYLNIETELKTNSGIYFSNAIDTFHFESIDASKKHLEKFYQTSIRNNLVRNISALRTSFYNSDKMNSECFDSTNSKSHITDNVSINISGRSAIQGIELPDKIDEPLSQNWSFKIATNPQGELTYIEIIGDINGKYEEVRAIADYLHELKLATINENHCWKVLVSK